MGTLSYKKLYKYYTEIEQLSTYATLKNIWKVRNMPAELKEVVAQIISKEIDKLDVTISNIEVHGVLLSELVEQEGMTRIGAVQFLDWLMREPYEAIGFLHTEQLRTPIEPLNNKEQEIVRLAIENLKKAGAEEPLNDDFIEEQLEEDISI